MNRPAWTVRALLTAAAKYLAERGVDTARLDAERLLAHVLGAERIDLYAEPEREVADEARARLRELVRRRGAREPAQYVLGRSWFYGLELRADPRALCPRRETELLVDRALEAASGRPVRVLELGTGCGAVALALAKNLPEGARIFACDRSGEALDLARENATELGLEERVVFLEGDLFEALGEGGPPGPFDIIAANLPYVPGAQIESLAPEVRDHEPREALDGGADGLEVIRRAVAGPPPAGGAPGHLDAGGWLLLEVGAGQAREVSSLLDAAGLAVEKPLRDPGGIERVVHGRRD